MINIEKIIKRDEGFLIPAKFELFSKNSHIAQIFSQMGWSEELGTGIRKVYKYAKAFSGCDKIEFIEQDLFITRVPLDTHFFDSIKDMDELNGELNDTQILVLNRIKEIPGINANELALQLYIPFSTIDKYTRFFIAKRLIERKGSKKTGGYFARKKTNNQ